MPPATPVLPPPRLINRLLLWACWLSCVIFGLYIVIFYGGAALLGSMERDWNEVLPRLYQASGGSANFMIGLHFIAGAVVLVLGPLQFIPGVRERWPRVHRYSGYIFLSASTLAGIGGLVYLILQGTVGGPMMTAGFAVYGTLILIASAQTVRHAIAGRTALHRAWAIRLFTLGLGSWLYRMEYGLWLKGVHGPGHASGTFDGPFDMVMDFFYVPHLLVAEYLIRRARPHSRKVANWGGGIALLLLVAATCLFALAYWLPHVRDQLARLAAM